MLWVSGILKSGKCDYCLSNLIYIDSEIERESESAIFKEFSHS